MLLNLLAFATALTVALAAPATSSPTPRPKAYTDTFDSPAAQAAGLLPAGNLVNNTAGGALAYNGFAYSNTAASTATLPPPSYPDIITTGVATQQLQGQPAWYPINSSVLYFTQQSIYYACFLQSEAPVAVPTTCMIQVAGLNTAGLTVVQELVYNPGILPVGSAYVKAIFNPVIFSNLVRMDVAVIAAALGTTAVIPGFDNNSYTAYFKS